MGVRCDLKKAAKTDLLFQLEALAFVLILELVVFDLDALECLDVELDLDGEALEVSGALAHEGGELSVNHA